MGKLLNKYRQLGPELFFKKLIGCDISFSCGVRPKGSKLLYEGETQQPFHLMPRSKDFWYADPLFYEYDGRHYLFMEAYDQRTDKGKLICSEIVNGEFTELITVIDEPFHMSFPNIFEFQDELYMLPEVEASGGINVYHCEHFPDKWQLIFHTDTEVPVVDSTVESINGNVLHILASTYDPDNLKVTKYYDYTLDFTDRNQILFQPGEALNKASAFTYESRNAGRYEAVKDGCAVHCTQTSTDAVYGYSLKFFDAEQNGNHWDDLASSMREIKPGDVKTVNWQHTPKLIGVHTYSTTSEYEAIDIEFLEWRAEKWPKKVSGYIKMHK